MTKHLPALIDAPRRGATLLAALVVVACGSKAPPPAMTPAPHEAAAAPTPPAPTPPPPAPAPPAPEPAKDLPTADDGEVQHYVALETEAFDKARPVFAKYCASCHTKGGKKADAKKLGHFNMTTYPFTGEHARSIGNEIRVVLAIDGARKPSMPSDKPGSVQGDDLAAIKAWTEAWRAAGAAGAHPADPADRDDD